MIKGLYEQSLLFVLLCYLKPSFSFLKTQSTWSNIGYEYSPINLDILLLVSPPRITKTAFDCAFSCHSNYRCRTFDFDTLSKQCRIFQGDLTTGTIIQSTSSTSKVGSIKLTNDNFINYQKSCSYCSDDRDLICLNGICLCHPYTYWNGNKCQPQLFYGSPCTTSDMCRTELNYICLTQFGKCAPLSALAGTTISGNSDCTAGTNMSALDSPETVFVSPFDSRSVYISDTGNNRILKFTPNLTKGILVAGGFGSGSNPNQISQSVGIYVDAQSNIYAGEYGNKRIQYWPKNSTQGYTIAQLTHGPCITDVVVDSHGYMYAGVDSEIQRFYPTITSSTSVAGSSTYGSSSSQLNDVNAIDLDEQNSVLYVADTGNHRIQLFRLNISTIGTTIAGFGGLGANLNQLNGPRGVKFSRKTGVLYIADTDNHRILRYAPNASNGVVLFGTTSVTGCNPYLLNRPHHISLNPEETYLYVAEKSNNRVQRFNLL